MNKIKRYVPSMFSGANNKEYEFSTLEELMEVEFVKYYKVYFGETFKGVYFKQFSICVTGIQNMLMCEYIEEGESRYCVVGILSSIEGIENMPRCKTK